MPNNVGNARLQQNSNTFLTMLAMLDYSKQQYMYNNASNARLQQNSNTCITMLAMLDYSKQQYMPNNVRLQQNRNICITMLAMLDYSEIAIHAQQCQQCQITAKQQYMYDIYNYLPLNGGLYEFFQRVKNVFLFHPVKQLSHEKMYLYHGNNVFT